MNNERRHKLKRLMGVRAKELESRVSALSTARTRQSELEQRLLEAQQKRQNELLARRARLHADLPAAEWGHAENWLLGLTEKEWTAVTQNEAGCRAVLDARDQVTRAKREQDKIQLLLDRLGAEAKRAEARAQRKLEDEVLTSQQAIRERNSVGKTGR
jgi:flagellar biosynthesis chaperone FliJ